MYKEGFLRRGDEEGRRTDDDDIHTDKEDIRLDDDEEDIRTDEEDIRTDEEDIRRAEEDIQFASLYPTSHSAITFRFIIFCKCYKTNNRCKTNVKRNKTCEKNKEKGYFY